MLFRALFLAGSLACACAASATESSAPAPAPAPVSEPAPHVPSALAWDKTRIELKAEPGQQRAEVAFTFRNAGAKPVTLTSVTSSCGCTTTQLKKNTYAPDEKGEIRAIFEFGDRSGPQQKVLTVKTDDAEVATQLVLRVDIPETLTMEPRIVQWRSGEAAEPKVVTIRTAATGVTVEGLDFDAKLIEATLEPLPTGGGYRVLARPLSTAEPARLAVQVRAKVGDLPRVLPLYVYVR